MGCAGLALNGLGWVGLAWAGWGDGACYSVNQVFVVRG